MSERIIDKTEELSIVPDGNDFLLIRKDKNNKEASIKLSAANIINLPRVTKQPIACLLESMKSDHSSQLSASPIPTVPASGFVASQNLDGSLVLLSIRDQQEIEFCFSFQPYQAKQVAQALLEKTDNLSSLAPPGTKTVQ